MLRLLGRRDYSVYEVRIKMRRLGVDSVEADFLITDFLKRGWLDDERFAHSFARARWQRGHGPRKLKAELAQKGVDSALAEEAVQATVGSDELSQAKVLVEKRQRQGKDRESTFRFLASRGYRTSAIIQALQGY